MWRCAGRNNSLCDFENGESFSKFRVLFLQGFSLTKPHESRNLFLDGPAGRLEAIFWKPQDGARPPLAAVVCHPHPLFGGTMHNKVIYQTAKSLDSLGLPVLRFNFRGAGMSEGKHDRGRGELGDVRAALDFLAGEFAGVPLLVAGFSFGCWVGLRVGCEDERVSELIGLGAPVNNTDFSFLESCGKPKLFVHGSNDEHGDVDVVEKLVAGLPGENRFVVVPDADHFFAGKLDQLDRAITAWFRDRHTDLLRSDG
jgi:alpha/beta superfamily hydrolase